MAISFEWDPHKATRNLALHSITFDEALTVFADPLGRILDDDRHSVSEKRLILLGTSSRDRLLTVMFTERGPERIRLTSARQATRSERREYEEGRR